jgi:anti-anti-sigma factor
MPKDGSVAWVERAAHGTTVALVGELDGGTVQEVSRMLGQECARRPSRLTLDLSGVEFVDSAALHLFVKVHRRLEEAGCVLELRFPTPHVQRVLELTSLDTLIASRPRAR